MSAAYSAGVAQLVEQLFCKQRVGGSIPLAGLNEATTYRANEMSEYKLSGRIYPECVKQIYLEICERLHEG